MSVRKIIQVTFFGLFGLVVFGHIIGKIDENSKTPEQKTAIAADKAEHDRAWDHDFKILWNVKENAITMNLANKSDISGWNHSVDLTIGSHDSRKADVLANAVCRQANLGLINKQWKIRVFFADGTLASECKIIS
jgi:hypothetical protein